MDQNRLRSTTAINTSLSSNKDEKSRNPYGAVKLKKTNRASDGVRKNQSSNVSITTASFARDNLKKTTIPPKTLPSKNTTSKTYNTESLKNTGNVQFTKQKNGETSSKDDDKSWLRGIWTETEKTSTLEKHACDLMAEIICADERSSTKRRLSISDNDLVSMLVRATEDDPSITEIVIDGDNRFKNIKPELVVAFAEGLRTNFNLRKLIIRKVELGNEFLSMLADSIRTNFMLEYIDLSSNAFTNDALADFCQSMAENQSIRFLDLADQHSPIFTMRQDIVVTAIESNEYVHELNVNFQTDSCSSQVQKAVKRNKESKKCISDHGEKLIQVLENEVANALKRKEQRKKEVSARELQESDMPYLYELSELASQYKLPYESVDDMKQSQHSFKLPSKASTTSLAAITSSLLTADGSFLTEDFISGYLRKGETDGSLTFDFGNQAKLFKRFATTDPARAFIVEKFVSVLVGHPKADEITHINMNNTMAGNDWIQCLCQMCLTDTGLLPKLHLINLESNFISGDGVIDLAKCIASPSTWKKIQAIKLDNQKRMISSEAEDDLARALCLCRSVIKLSLRVRNMFERRKINEYLARNIDFLRQARRWHAVKTGTVKERARNKIEKLFDSIAANDPSITIVEVIADQNFLTLHADEILKAAKSFDKNTHVKQIKMSGLRLDNKFAIELSKSLLNNATVEKLDLETNFIGSEGVVAIVRSLETNRTVKELLLRHQAKNLSSSDEEKLTEYLKDNEVVMKLSVDLRSTIARHSLDQKLRQNQEFKRRAAPKKAPSGKRNRIQQQFDLVKENDASVTSVNVVCDQVFMSMNATEILKTATCFANNTHVKAIKMSGLKLDDNWAVALAESLQSNTALEKIDIESNSIGSEGLLAIVGTLTTNSTIQELLLRHQTKPMTSTDEEKIPGLLECNDKIVKLSISIRSVHASSTVDIKLRRNQELKRKNRNKK